MFVFPLNVVDYCAHSSSFSVFSFLFASSGLVKFQIFVSAYMSCIYVGGSRTGYAD